MSHHVLLMASTVSGSLHGPHCERTRATKLHSSSSSDRRHGRAVGSTVSCAFLWSRRRRRVALAGGRRSVGGERILTSPGFFLFSFFNKISKNDFFLSFFRFFLCASSAAVRGPTRTEGKKQRKKKTKMRQEEKDARSNDRVVLKRCAFRALRCLGRDNRLPDCLSSRPSLSSATGTAHARLCACNYEGATDRQTANHLFSHFLFFLPRHFFVCATAICRPGRAWSGSLLADPRRPFFFVFSLLWRRRLCGGPARARFISVTSLALRSEPTRPKQKHPNLTKKKKQEKKESIARRRWPHTR